MSVNPSQLDLITRLLDVASIRQRVISQNIANVNTPGYHRQEVGFEQHLRSLLDSGDEAELAGIEPSIFATKGLSERSDGNNVDIDVEIGQLTKNGLLFETYSQILATKLGMIRSAISGQA